MAKVIEKGKEEMYEEKIKIPIEIIEHKDFPMSLELTYNNFTYTFNFAKIDYAELWIDYLNKKCGIKLEGLVCVLSKDIDIENWFEKIQNVVFDKEGDTFSLVQDNKRVNFFFETRDQMKEFIYKNIKQVKGTIHITRK